VITAALDLSIAIQLIAAAGTSVAMLAVVRPSLVKRLHTGPELRLGHGKLVGKQGVVTETVTSLNPGRIKLAGEIWSAAPYDESLTIEPGETVEVFEIRGATAYVHPLPRLES
jgi:membrane protein implicated in regulation of membrane protease activity